MVSGVLTVRPTVQVNGGGSLIFIIFLGVKLNFIDQTPQSVEYISGYEVEQATRDAGDLTNAKI